MKQIRQMLCYGTYPEGVGFLCSHYCTVRCLIVFIGNNHSVESPIFRWDEGERKFVQYQTVVTVGAQDWTHFEVEGNHFLVVANAFSTQSTATTRLNSSIYFWQNDRFFLFQNIEVHHPV